MSSVFIMSGPRRDIASYVLISRLWSKCVLLKDRRWSLDGCLAWKELSQFSWGRGLEFKLDCMIYYFLNILFLRNHLQGI